MKPPTGAMVQDLPTPSLLLDLDILERNLDAMQARARDLGVRLRPHVKTHKCIEIARMQIDRGASGITVSTLEEARVFADHGFPDITWAFPLILSRVEEVRQIAARTRLGVTVDSVAAVEALEAAGLSVPVWIKVDCGYGRAGVDPTSDGAVEVARRISEAPGLDLAGCLTHAGHTYAQPTIADVARVAEEERAVMVAFADRLRAAGLDPGRLSVGSTPGMSVVESLAGVDEARPGNYSLYDYTQTRIGSCGIESCASSVLTSVVSSRAGRDRCVADSGALVMSKDTGPDTPVHYGRAYETLEGGNLDPDLRIVSVSQEHSVLSRALPVGTRVRVAPNHSCLTVARFDHFTVIRANTVIDQWKIWRDRGPAPAPARVAQSA